MAISLLGAPLVAIGATLQRMASVAERFPQITLVHAHDLRGFAGLPRL